jgi:hypothetical protein
MAEKPRVPFGALVDDRLTAAFERNLSHAGRVDRPERVDSDVWERYDAGRPWVLLNVGIMGLHLQRPETVDVLREASSLFFERRSNYWLVAELIASRGSLAPETAFGETVYEAAMHTVHSAIAAKRGFRTNALDLPYPGLAAEAVSLIFCAIAKNSGAYRDRVTPYVPPVDQAVIDELLRGVRSADRDVDRRLANLRAIAGRRFGNRANLASLKSLIWGAIGASTVAHEERDEGFALMGVEPILDPVTLATGMLILQEGDQLDLAMARGSELQRGARERPRGWDDNIDLSAGIEAYLTYVSALLQQPRR